MSRESLTRVLQISNLPTCSAVAKEVRKPKVCRGHVEKKNGKNIPGNLQNLGNLMEFFHCIKVGTLKKKHQLENYHAS